MEWRCLWVFPGKSSKNFLNIYYIFECFVKCNIKNVSNIFNSFNSMVVKSYRVRSLSITDLLNHGKQVESPF